MGPHLMRFPDWPERLARALEEARGLRFAWGECDCCLWSACVVQALTGMDFAASWRGRYADAAGAYRLLARSGGLVALVTRLLGQPFAPALAWRGDVLLAEFDGAPTLGIATDRGGAFKSRSGLVFLPLRACLQAWGVGHAA